MENSTRHDHESLHLVLILYWSFYAQNNHTHTYASYCEWWNIFGENSFDVSLCKDPGIGRKNKKTNLPQIIANNRTAEKLHPIFTQKFIMIALKNKQQNSQTDVWILQWINMQKKSDFIFLLQICRRLCRSWTKNQTRFKIGFF